MKKIILTLSCALLILSGCGDTSNKASTSLVEKTIEAATGGQFKRRFHLLKILPYETIIALSDLVVFLLLHTSTDKKPKDCSIYAIVGLDV